MQQQYEFFYFLSKTFDEHKNNTKAIIRYAITEVNIILHTLSHNAFRFGFYEVIFRNSTERYADRQRELDRHLRHYHIEHRQNRTS